MGSLINNLRNYGFIDGIKQTFSDINVKKAKFDLKIAMAPHPKLDGIRQALVGGKLSHVNGKELSQTTSVPSSVPKFIQTKFERTVRFLNDKVNFRTQSLRDKDDWDSGLITTTTKENAEKFSARDIKRLANAARWLPQGSSESNHAKEMVHAALDLISTKINKMKTLAQTTSKKLAAIAKLFPEEVAKAVADAPDSSNDLQKLLPKEKPSASEIFKNNNPIPKPAPGNLSEFHQEESSTIPNNPTELSQPQRPAQEELISNPGKPLDDFEEKVPESGNQAQTNTPGGPSQISPQNSSSMEEASEVSLLDSGVKVTVKDLAGIMKNLADVMPGTNLNSTIKRVADVDAKAAKELKKLLRESQPKVSAFSKFLNFFQTKPKS